MRYYLSAPNKHVMDIWRDDETAVPGSHWLRHVKRISGDSEDSPYPDVDDAEQFLPFFPPYSKISPYIVARSDSIEKLYEYAAIQALFNLDPNTIIQAVDLSLQHL